MDGLSANDDAAGVGGIPYSVDAVEQFQVVTSGGQAELGRALGGYVSVVTKSGTNAVHGTTYGFFRDDAFNGANALSKTKLPMDQRQCGASLGGPVARNRTFYFTNVEHRLLDQSGIRDDRTGRRGHDQRPAGTGGLSGRSGEHRRVSESGPLGERARQDRPRRGSIRPAERALQPV